MKFKGSKIKKYYDGGIADKVIDRNIPVTASTKLADYFKSNAIPLALSGLAGYAGGKSGAGVAAGAIIPLVVKLAQAKAAKDAMAKRTAAGAGGKPAVGVNERGQPVDDNGAPIGRDMLGPDALPDSLNPPGVGFDPGAVADYTGTDGMKRGGAVKKAKGGGFGIPSEEDLLNRVRVSKGAHHNYPKFRKEPLFKKAGGSIAKKAEGDLMMSMKKKKGGMMKCAEGGPCEGKMATMKKMAGGPVSGSMANSGPIKTHKEMSAEGVMRKASGGAVRGWGISKHVPTGGFE